MEFRAETRIYADQILPCDRTVKNDLDRLAIQKRNIIKKVLVSAAENRCLSISPDNWMDNHRRISYIGATAHFIDEDFSYHAIDLFCVEFAKEKKTVENIYEVSLKSFSPIWSVWFSYLKDNWRNTIYNDSWTQLLMSLIEEQIS